MHKGFTGCGGNVNSDSTGLSPSQSASIIYCTLPYLCCYPYTDILLNHPINTSDYLRGMYPCTNLLFVRILVEFKPYIFTKTAFITCCRHAHTRSKHPYLILYNPFSKIIYSIAESVTFLYSLICCLRCWVIWVEQRTDMCVPWLADSFSWVAQYLPPQLKLSAIHSTRISLFSTQITQCLKQNIKKYRGVTDSAIYHFGEWIVYYP